MAGLGGAPDCMTCGKSVYFNEQKQFMSRIWHKYCFKCYMCRKPLESGTANLNEQTEKLTCNQCYRKSQQGPRTAALQPKQEYVNHDDLECCPRCGRRVYFAEQTLALGRKWHHLCFTCVSCSKRVEPSNITDHDGELYCKQCHARNFGPKGYGFAGGSGTGLSMDTGRAGVVSREYGIHDNGQNHHALFIDRNVPHTVEAYNAPRGEAHRRPARVGPWGMHAGAEMCARCDKQVFIAERKQAAGNVYHVTCFTCAMCTKKLDATLAEKENEIYCKNCYGKQFAPKGYGYGVGSGTLSMAT